MRNDLELQRDVQNAIKWEPSMNAAEIGVTAKDGLITLSGKVDSYSKKINAENAVKKVKGVKAIVEEMTIDYGYSFKKDDSDIANDILIAWKANWEVPQDKIKVKVEDGWVEIDGEVAWKFQEEASKDCIKNLSGVNGVTNLIKVKSESKDILEKKELENSLNRNWSIDAKDIKIDVNLNKVKLTGLVHSLYQKDEAGRLAWNTPGVSSVDNELAVIN
ncbi:BON domain-containing protein [Arcticibacterium luteifluviistationis]|uniref:Ornithine aminotransferase n=1 Tax=Arcticibacterium luteifluviistationis TaxID=1784714 RepID=A0A2Z4G6K6_9BACT|nr:BON domain-containing protein [Arcticibacterium luteifluviistationis]AWV96779.1 ornithine aminotransferase [Arcticibacterium luteifluviistationis]